MPQFVRSLELDAPASAVFRFHEREDALELLTPKFPPVEVISRQGGILAGGRVELSVLGIRWVALHTQYQQDRLFVDSQIQGPFRKWVHRHEFEDLGGGRCRLTDRVEFELPGGAAVNMLFGWVVKFGLAQMFWHRHRVTLNAIMKA